MDNIVYVGKLVRTFEISVAGGDEREIAGLMNRLRVEGFLGKFGEAKAEGLIDSHRVEILGEPTLAREPEVVRNCGPSGVMRGPSPRLIQTVVVRVEIAMPLEHFDRTFLAKRLAELEMWGFLDNLPAALAARVIHSHRLLSEDVLTPSAAGEDRD